MVAVSFAVLFLFTFGIPIGNAMPRLPEHTPPHRHKDLVPCVRTACAHASGAVEPWVVTQIIRRRKMRHASLTDHAPVWQNGKHQPPPPRRIISPSRGRGCQHLLQHSADAYRRPESLPSEARHVRKRIKCSHPTVAVRAPTPRIMHSVA